MYFLPVIFAFIGLCNANVLNREDVCKALLGDALIQEIASYESVKDEILKYVTEGDFKGKTYNELEKFVDKFGARPSGSEALEQSIDYIIQLTREEGLNDVTTEELEVPHWVRGEEKVTMLEPRIKNIAVLGLGSSISTSPEGITAEVIVVNSFEELDSYSDSDIEGKIVLYDQLFTTYAQTVPYRSTGAVRAAAKGAVASLVRSVSPFSINSPHTGVQVYDDNVKKIPAAAITLEDADLIRRITSRGEKVVLNIKLLSTSDTKTSRNTIIDHEGTEKPDNLVIVSGHIDSWDVGQGAMDDGGGVFVSWAVPVILKNLNLKPRRTIRTIFWTAEEFGVIGVTDYEQRHRNESYNINIAMESDEGTFEPRGLIVAGNEEAKCILAEILKLFESMNASTMLEGESASTDIGVFIKKGIPGASMHTENPTKYWFHHTEGDTMNIEDDRELDLGAAFWTAVSYIIADISADIPR